MRIRPSRLVELCKPPKRRLRPPPTGWRSGPAGSQSWTENREWLGHLRRGRRRLHSLHHHRHPEPGLCDLPRWHLDLLTCPAGEGSEYQNWGPNGELMNTIADTSPTQEGSPGRRKCVDPTRRPPRITSKRRYRQRLQCSGSTFASKDCARRLMTPSTRTISRQRVGATVIPFASRRVYAAEFVRAAAITRSSSAGSTNVRRPNFTTVTVRAAASGTGHSRLTRNCSAASSSVYRRTCSALFSFME
ncbi:hypothetical protein DE4585_00166 [Mycobacteroides salmoniphilum]|uniref:Uncharacterized protein n=1 Tax=Mycobacteroides salmoniphilum TaxID=404941 RepID=A0A4V3HYT6_9MYCO|nr:hypothetical protein DE4585_00166 [Mycobacteroides salmoniphilum]